MMPVSELSVYMYMYMYMKWHVYSAPGLVEKVYMYMCTSIKMKMTVNYNVVEMLIYFPTLHSNEQMLDWRTFWRYV